VTVATDDTATIKFGLTCAATGRRYEWEAEVSWLSPDIMFVRRAFGDLLADAVEACEEHGEWERSTTVDAYDETDAGEEHDSRTSFRCPITFNGDKAPHAAIQRIGTILMTVAPHYVAKYQEGNSFALVGWEEKATSGYEMLRYQEGQYFKIHVDASYKSPVLSKRRLSVIAFPNDDYEGGRLFFPRQNIYVPKEAGSLVIFPSGFTHPHEAEPVLAGTKYCAVTWYF
jgi:hypothetical protein